jgi:hypothetical protein
MVYSGPQINSAGSVRLASCFGAEWWSILVDLSFTATVRIAGHSTQFTRNEFNAELSHHVHIASLHIK